MQEIKDNSVSTRMVKGQAHSGAEKPYVEKPRQSEEYILPKMFQYIVPHLIYELMKNMFNSEFNDNHYITTWSLTQPEDLEPHARELLERSPIYMEMMARWDKHREFMRQGTKKEIAPLLKQVIPRGPDVEILHRLNDPTFEGFMKAHSPLFEIDEDQWRYHRGDDRCKQANKYFNNPSRKIDECVYGVKLGYIIMAIYEDLICNYRRQWIWENKSSKGYIPYVTFPPAVQNTIATIIWEVMTRAENIPKSFPRHRRECQWKRISKFYYTIKRYRFGREAWSYVNSRW